MQKHTFFLANMIGCSFVGKSILAVAILSASICAAQNTAVAGVFGSNVIIFHPTLDSAAMQSKIDAVYAQQQHSEFGTGRYTLLFMPGEYHLDVPVGFYTQVIGVGSSPDSTKIVGNVHADAAARNNNATTTFWRGIEGVSVVPSQNTTMQWAVSQATFVRRSHIVGNLVLHQNHGWASGGWLADSVIDGHVNSGTQQQWISRNAEWKDWTGSNWNMVFVGVKNAPAGEYPKPPFTRIPLTPVIREKPFLVYDKDKYSVVVPNIQRNSSGATWHERGTPGKSSPLSSFYVAKSDVDTATTMNAALRRGQNLLLTPGSYSLDSPLLVNRKDAIVYGLGFATLRPSTGKPAMILGDADGITVSGLLFDAGPTVSSALLQVGPAVSTKRHKLNPVSLHDVFFRVGGAAVGKVDANLVINSNDVIVDHTWIWRADHGAGARWTENISKNGIIVNGSDVSIYGLFVEHHQEYQVLWNGERGHTYFYQSELPYDPPTQDAWNSGADSNGWAAYKVAANVKQHEAYGLGIYSVFRNAEMKLTHAIEAPTLASVAFRNMITVSLVNHGEITHIVNDAGEATVAGPTRIDRTLTQYPVP
jgi:hypothetical protein